MRSLFALFSLVSLPALAVGVNDTGIGFCSIESGGTAACASVAGDEGTHPRQDARYGREAAAAAGKLNKVGGGEAGFDFTALDASSQPIRPGSGDTPHPCVRDNLSGLTWEVKTADGGLRDQKWTYSWYDSVHNYGGTAGTASGTTNCQSSGRCDTEKYVADVNAVGLCGFSDWRMPTRYELLDIAHQGRADPSIDPIYFPNTPSSYFWSGSSYANYSYYAWYVDFVAGYVRYSKHSFGNSVRLVRGGQLFTF
jgi:hypothetical protein